MPYVQTTLVVDYSVRSLCARPYEGHPRGCPNHGRSSRCPPAAPHLDQVYDMSGPFWLVYSVFPLGEHAERMRVAHPGWSPRQLGCVLYWQGTARRRLREEIALFREAHPEAEWLVETTPEAMGCDVTATMKSVGVDLEWPPAGVAHHVALAGTSSCLHVRRCYAEKKPVRAACPHVWPGVPENWCSGCRSNQAGEGRSRDFDFYIFTRDPPCVIIAFLRTMRRGMT